MCVREREIECRCSCDMKREMMGRGRRRRRGWRKVMNDDAADADEEKEEGRVEGKATKTNKHKG